MAMRPPIATTLTLLAGAMLIMLAGTSSAAAKHQEADLSLVSSEPAANAVLPDPPGIITLTFSEPVEPDTIAIRLLDVTGATVDAVNSEHPEPATVTLTPTTPLDHGSWLVSWEIDRPGAGAPAGGFYGFTVGTDQSVAPITIPDTGFTSDNTPRWLAIAAWGTMLTGLAILIAIWPFWSLVVRPVMRGTVSLAPSIRRLQILALAGTACATTGALLVQAVNAWNDGSGAFLNRYVAAIAATSTARLLLLTVALVFLHTLTLGIMSWATPSQSRWIRLIPWLTTFVLTVPAALLSHAIDEPAGRAAAITVTWLMLTALSLWIGCVLANAVVASAPTVHGTQMRHAAAALALAALTVILAGDYAGWLFVGNRTALTSTDYGRLFMVAGVLCGLLLIVSIAMILVGRHASTRRRISMIAGIAGVATLFAVGGLLATDTARSTLVRESTQEVVPLDLAGDRAQLILAPGYAGVNHFRLEIDRPSIPLQTTATLTMSLPSYPELGRETVPLPRVSGDAFEYHGSELVISGQWNITVRVTEPGHDAISGTVPLILDASMETVDVPGVPWRFASFGGTAGWLMIVIGCTGIVIGAAAGKTPVRRESAGIGAIALVLAVILLGQARLDPILAVGGNDGGAINPDDLAMITRGEEIYQANCLSCHGAELRGDGAASEGMQPPPADFSMPHTMMHDEATLIYWLRHGKQGTAMPAFGDTLSDQDIRDVLSYIARKQREFVDTQGMPATPVPAAGS